MVHQRKHTRTSKKGKIFPAGKRSFGSAEFKVVGYPDRVELIIHGDHMVARSYEDVYTEIFNYCVRKLGGRKDDWIE
jgi:hypothetical protein